MKSVKIILLLSSFFLARAYELCGVLYDIIDTSPSAPKVSTVPLKAVDVKAEIRGLTVGLTAELVYENILNTTIQTRFVFPLSNEAAVYKLEAVIAGKRLIAKVEPVEKAREIYRQAVDAGKQAVLLESQKESGDIFRLSLGNLPALETAIVKIGYIQPLDQLLSDGVLSFTLPMVLNPRYVPSHELANLESITAKLTTKDYIAVSEMSYKMYFSAVVNLGPSRSIQDIQMRHVLDKIDVTWGNQSTSVVLVSEFKKDHDLELLIRPSNASKPFSTVFVEPGLNTGDNSYLTTDIAAAWIMPIPQMLTDGVRPSDFEFWLVVDRSGSMEGSKMDDAKAALSLLVGKLPSGCFFNIIGFGSTYVTLFPEGAVLYDGSTVETAVSHLKSIRADLGGTEILEPLKFIYNQRSSEKQRHILLVTDGEVSNTNEVIKVAGLNADTTRVFAVGIGEGVSTALVNGVARVSGGLASFVRSKNDRLKTKVESMLAAMTAPRMENAKLSWTTKSGQVLEKVPKEFQKFYLEKPILQSAVMRRSVGSGLSGKVAFSQLGVGTDFSASFTIAAQIFSSVDDSLPLHRLSAKKMMQELVDDYYITSDEEAKRKATEISIKTGVLNEFTAMVAVDADSNKPINASSSGGLEDSGLMVKQMSSGHGYTNAVASFYCQTSPMFMLSFAVINVASFLLF